jgi:hypothetical protein
MIMMKMNVITMKIRMKVKLEIMIMLCEWSYQQREEAAQSLTCQNKAHPNP